MGGENSRTTPCSFSHSSSGSWLWLDARHHVLLWAMGSPSSENIRESRATHQSFFWNSGTMISAAPGGMSQTIQLAPLRPASRRAAHGRVPRPLGCLVGRRSPPQARPSWRRRRRPLPKARRLRRPLRHHQRPGPPLRPSLLQPPLWQRPPPLAPALKGVLGLRARLPALRVLFLPARRRGTPLAPAPKWTPGM